jgi:hypothetical protein
MTTNTSKNNGRVNWEQIKRTNREKWDEYHHEDGELSTLALLRGIHKIQVKGGSGADEQAFLDRVGFKPIQTDAPAADASDDDQDSTSGTKRQLQARIRLLEQQLLDAASSPHVDEAAFQAHVDGRVAEAVAAEYERSRAEIAALRRECVGENRLLEAVLQKFDVSLEQAKQALVEYDAHHPDGATPAGLMKGPPPGLAPAAAMLRDPSYVAFERIATRGLPRHRHGLRAQEARRRRRKGRKGPWCAP